MSESASAVSQIAEEEHKGEKQSEREREQKRECEREHKRQEKEKFEIMQHGAKCLKMADVRSQRKSVLGIRS